MKGRIFLFGLALLAPLGCRAEARPPAIVVPAVTAASSDARRPSGAASGETRREPSATAAPVPTATSLTSPTPTAIPSPTATVVPAPRRLTDGGCCWRPFFLDGQIAFIDRPGPEAPVGFYAVPPEGGAPTLIESRLGSFLGGGKYFGYQEGDLTVIERRADSRRWTVDTGGQQVVLAPDESQIAWSLREWQGAFDRRQAVVWRATLDGNDAQPVIELLGGGLSAWLPEDRWLMSGRRLPEESDRTLFIYDLNTGERRDLFQALSFRSVSVSPDGKWVVFLVAQDPEQDRNGIWLARTDGGELRKLEWFGAYAWRDAGHLFFLPFQPAATSHEVWLYDVAANSSRRLTDPAVTAFKIAQGDFAFAPDGRAIVYVSAHDRNIWLLPLPAD